MELPLIGITVHPEALSANPFGRPTNARVVEIPHVLLGFAEHDLFIGVPLTDTGRGTFTLSGQQVTDAETLAVLKLRGE